jgi:hypothetical protein
MKTGLALLLVCPLFACNFAPPLYWAESIHGRVVDADGGAPIAGAVVLADWKLYGGGFGHGGHRSSLFVQETLTDANGEFSFGKWGPKRRPPGMDLDTAPWLVVFKSGYEHRFLPNEHAGNGFVRRSDWDGKTIELKRLPADINKRMTVLDIVLSISEGQSLMLSEILKDRAAYYRHAPAFFDHVEALLSERGKQP